MKKLLVLALTLGMVIGAASVSMAAGTVSLDVLSGGETKTSNQNLDLSQVTLGFEVPIEHFKIAGSFSNGEIKDVNLDTSCYTIKGGIAVMDNKQLRLDITGGYFNRKHDNYYPYYRSMGEESLTSLTIGIDSKFIIEDNMWFDASFGLGLKPKHEVSVAGNTFDSDMDSLTTLNLKFNYSFTKQFGGALGYNWEKWEYKSSGKKSFSGLTAGVFVKF